MKNVIKLLVLIVAVMSVMLAFASCGCSHEETPIEAVAATCDKDGATAGTKCKLCDAILVAPEPIPATGHDYKSVGPKAATCTEDGYEAGMRCEICDKVKSGCAPIPAAHKPGDVAGKEPTCTEPGYTEGTRCTVCNADVSGFEEIPALDHDLEDREEIAATCTVAGSKAGKKCSRCDYYEGLETIPAVGHKNMSVNRVEPTCDTDGHEAGIRCEVCKEPVEGCATLPALGHTPGDITVITPSDLGVEGKGTSVCTVCNEPIELTLPAKLGGKWDYTSTDDMMVLGKNTGGVATTELVTEGDKSYVKITITNPGIHPNSGESGVKASKNTELILSWKPDLKDASMSELKADNYFVFKTKLKIDSVITKWTPAGTLYDNNKEGAVDQFYSDWLIYPSLSTNTTAENSQDQYNIWTGFNAVFDEENTTGKIDGIKFSSAGGVVVDENPLKLGEWMDLTFVYELNDENSGICDIAIFLGDTLVYFNTLNLKAEAKGVPIQDYRIKFKNTRCFDEFVICFDDTTFEELQGEPDIPAIPEQTPAA